MSKLLMLGLGLAVAGCIGCSGDTKTVEVPVEKIVYVDVPVEVESQGSIVLTFDDGVCVNSWVDNKELLHKYEAKATFFVSHYSNNDFKDKLLTLQGEGFEIAHHSTYHHNAVTFSNENGIDEWLRVEVDYTLDMMNDDGLNIETFAFPYGAFNDDLVESLRGRFSKVRGYLSPKTDNLRLGTQTDGFFYGGIGIDTHMLTDDVYAGMDRAKDKGLDLVVAAHCIELDGSWHIKTDELEGIMDYAHQIGLQFKMFKELK